MDIFKKIKELLESKSRKKLIENTVIVIIIGVIAIISGSTFLSGNKKPETGDALEQNSQRMETSTNSPSTASEAELKLRNILSQVEGAGKVEVMITYSTGKEYIPVYDTKISGSSTDEKDNEGGTRKITQSSSESTVVYANSQNGEKSPFIIKELEPVVKGVLIVSEGASDPQVRERLNKAVQVLLDIPLHMIQVIERKK